MPKLVFHSTNPEYAPSNTIRIVGELQEAGFLGAKWQAPKSVPGERYLIGDKFLSQVTFMGCAPAIELAPSTEQPVSTEFCHVEIDKICNEVKFVRGSDFLIARCPHCRQRHVDWQVIPETLVYACDQCKVETPLSQYDWKNTAGCGRFFINLHGIYPQEAIPTANLLQTLEKISGTKWNYFYIQ